MPELGIGSGYTFFLKDTSGKGHDALLAARNQLLKLQGHHSAREFQDRLNTAIAQARPRELRSDEVE